MRSRLQSPEWHRSLLQVIAYCRFIRCRSLLAIQLRKQCCDHAPVDDTQWPLSIGLPSAYNAAAFTTDGWFRSGDLACIDDSGYIRLTGRTKDLINRGGVKYNPTDIEALLIQNDVIDQAAIVVMPDTILGEKACCFVTLLPRFDLPLTEVCVLLEGENVSKVKWPERWKSLRKCR